MIYLFVLGDSLTSWRFTTRTEQLTKCLGPLKKLKVRLWPCKTILSPPVFHIIDRSKAIRLLWFLLFCLRVEF